MRTLRVGPKSFLRLTQCLGLVMVALCVAVGLSTLNPSTASAAGYCSGSADNHFAGFNQTASTPDYEGVSTYIVVRNGNTCSGDSTNNNFTTSWAMIAGQGKGAYAQVGFIRFAGGTLRWLSEYSTSGTSFTRTVSTYAVNSEIGVRHIFRVLWSASDARLHMYVDSSERDKTNLTRLLIVIGAITRIGLAPNLCLRPHTWSQTFPVVVTRTLHSAP